MQILHVLFFLCAIVLHVRGQVNESGEALSMIDLYSGPNPSWSPIGDKYAFLKNDALFIVHGDSTSIVRGAQNNYIWSHDGKSVIYTAKNSRNILKIFHYDISSGANTEVSTDSPWSDFYPSISPNDSIITYYSRKEKHFRLYYVRNNVTSKIESSADEDYFHPRWSPDGKYLVYEVDRGWGKRNVEVVEFSTWKVMIWLDSDKFDIYDWSPDSQEILVREVIDVPDTRKFYDQALVRINIRTGEKKLVTSKFIGITNADWYNEKTIAFSANKSIYLVNADGSDQRKVLSKAYYVDVNSDGTKMIFITTSKHYDIRIADIDGKNVKIVDKGPFPLGE